MKQSRWSQPISSISSGDRSTAPIFDLYGVHQQFGPFLALQDLNITIEPGERVALVGPSGAGKSTLLNLLNGSLTPTQGEVWAFGRNLARLQPRRLRQVQQQIGTVYQQHHLIPNLRVIHNVNAGHLGRWSFGKALWSLIWPLDVKTATQALTQVGIPEKLYERTDRLSGGQQQRVALARVLVQDPQVILADEPISSLDPARSHEMMDLLRSLCENTGKTLVISLHDLAFARSHCQRLIGLREGRILFDCPVTEVTDSHIAALYRLV